MEQKERSEKQKLTDQKLIALSRKHCRPIAELPERNTNFVKEKQNTLYDREAAIRIEKEILIRNNNLQDEKHLTQQNTCLGKSG